jgi:hypothetical protein
MSDKKPIWEVNEEEIDKYIKLVKEQINMNKTGAEIFEKKANEEPSNSQNKAFFTLAHLQQQNHIMALENHVSILIWSRDLNHVLSEKLQYLQDSIETISKKTNVKLKTVKTDIKKTQIINTQLYETLKNTQNAEYQKLKRMGESNFDYAKRSK